MYTYKYLFLFHFFFDEMWWEAQTHTNILPHLQPQTIWYFTSLLRLPCNVCKVHIYKSCLNDYILINKLHVILISFDHNGYVMLVYSLTLCAPADEQTDTHCYNNTEGTEPQIGNSIERIKSFSKMQKKKTLCHKITLKRYTRYLSLVCKLQWWIP